MVNLKQPSPWVDSGVYDGLRSLIDSGTSDYGELETNVTLGGLRSLWWTRVSLVMVNLKQTSPWVTGYGELESQLPYKRDPGWIQESMIDSGVSIYGELEMQWPV